MLSMTTLLLIFSAAQISAAAPVPDISLEGAISYCESTGGDVVYREAVYGTNGDMSTWLHLANVQGFCEYTSAEDGSRISVSLDTLRTKTPTLAALAYYAQVPSQAPNNGSNPASFYCTQLGGSDQFGGAGVAGGGWVSNSAGDQILQACIFPDLSSIDSFGLFYHQAGTIRGIDLSTVLQYKGPSH
jgi:hypothetical protein